MVTFTPSAKDEVKVICGGPVNLLAVVTGMRKGGFAAAVHFPMNGVPGLPFWDVIGSPGEPTIFSDRNSALSAAFELVRNQIEETREWLADAACKLDQYEEGFGVETELGDCSLLDQVPHSLSVN